MTAFQLIAPLPLLAVDAGCTITLEAISPGTGAAVSGVTVSNVTIYATNQRDAGTEPSPEYDSAFTFVGDA